MGTSDRDRYLILSCCNDGADWVQDSLDPRPQCPVCGRREPWTSIEDADMGVVGPGQFDVSAGRLVEVLEAWHFQGSLSRPQRGHIEVGRWTHGDDGDVSWEAVVDVTVYKDADVIRSMILSYYVDGRLALHTTLLSLDRLHEIVCGIAGAMEKRMPPAPAA